ncbi:MAG: hypothetical protein WAR24_04720, partial [Candidatus Acidiferrales bacterium]
FVALAHTRPVRLCTGSPPFNFLDELPYGIPHLNTTFVLELFGIPKQLCVGTQLESVEHRSACFCHRLLSSSDINFQLFQRPFDEQCIVDGGANPNPTLCGKATRKAKHLCTVRLHREIAQHTGIRLGSHVDRPSEDGAQPAVKHRVIDSSI